MGPEVGHNGFMANRRRRSHVSLGRLLERQPKTLAKHPLYPVLWNGYQASETLRSLRISRRCYRLLDGAKIAPENLEYFYRTYRLPKDPFFPYFLKIKRTYLADRKEWRAARERYILEKLKELDPRRRRFLRYLAEEEGRRRRDGSYPFWTDHLFPKTKKRADEIVGYDETMWIDYLANYLRRFERRYPRLPEGTADRLLACYVLGCVPGPEFRLPSRRTVTDAYRRLSKRYHPDAGGDPDLFRRIGWAREILTGRQTAR